MTKKLIHKTPAFYSVVVGLLTFIILSGTALIRGNAVDSGPDLTDIVIANVDIPSGARLTEKMLSVRSLPKKYADEGVLGSKSSLVGIETNMPVFKGEAIIRRKLRIKENRASGKATMVREGYRGFSILTDESDPQGRILRAGNQVDMLVTLNRDVLGMSVTKTILERKDVIAVEGLGRNDMYIVTLMVSPEEAQKLAYAQANGRISISICPAGDDSYRPLRDITAEEL